MGLREGNAKGIPRHKSQLGHSKYKKKALSFWSNAFVYSSNRHWTDPVSWPNIRYWLLLVFKGFDGDYTKCIQENCRSDDVNWQTHLRFFRCQLTRINLLLPLLLSLAANPSFAFVVNCVQMRTHFVRSFFIPEFSFKIKTNGLCNVPMSFTISRTLRTAKTESWISSVVSDVATSTEQPESSASLVPVRP